MIKVLSRSIREYKTVSILTPLLVIVEVILECAIPFVTANLVNEMQAGCTMDVIWRYGVILLVMLIAALLAIRTPARRIREMSVIETISAQ